MPDDPADVSIRELGAHEPVAVRPGMRTRVLVGPEDGVRELFVHDVVFAPGAAIPLHHHTVTEAWVILEGELAIRVGDETVVVEAERTVAIPAGVPHAVVNQDGRTARALTAAPWDHATFFTHATTYLEGTPRE